jgi:hypothetical protein
MTGRVDPRNTVNPDGSNDTPLVQISVLQREHHACNQYIKLIDSAVCDVPLCPFLLSQQLLHGFKLVCGQC